jgi:hypothetical protein
MKCGQSGENQVDVEEYVEAAQTILREQGMKTDVVRGHDLAFYRCETLSDRHIELVLRPRGWTIDYMFLPSKKTWRQRGTGVAELARSLGPLCEDTPFEPPTAPVPGAVIKKPAGL